MMINPSTESAILTMLSSQQERVITTLAEKFGFDQNEARETLGEITSVTRKEVKPRKPKEESKPKGKGKAKGATTIVAGEPVEEKPKKAKTGYLLFCDAARTSARYTLEAVAQEGVKVMAKDVVTLLGATWKNHPGVNQAAWKERAERIKAGEGHLLEEIEVDLAFWPEDEDED